jgi:hypothetical protein
MDPALKSVSIFDFPGHQTGIENIQYVKHSPITKSSNDGIIEFSFSTPGTDYLYPKFSKLCVKCKVVKENGTKCLDVDLYTPINLLFQTMWKDVNVSLQGHGVTTSSGNYAYKSYLKTILREGARRQNFLQSQFFRRDEEDFDKVGYTKEEMEAGTLTNEGMLMRMNWSKESKNIFMSGTLNDDFFETDRLLLPNIDINIKLVRNSDEFCIKSKQDTDTYTLLVEEVFFKACVVKLNPALYLSHVNVLNNTNALYPFERTEIKTNAIPAGQSQLEWDNFVQGKLPSRILISFVRQSAYLGKRTQNPFYLGHYKISNLVVTLNDQVLTQRAYKLNFTSGDYIEPYLNLMDIFDHNWGQGDLGLTLQQFSEGYTIFGYNVTDIIGEEQRQLPKLATGKLKLEVTFSDDLKENINCLAFLQFQKLMKVDFARNIFIED